MRSDADALINRLIEEQDKKEEETCSKSEKKAFLQSEEKGQDKNDSVKVR